jgi:chemotaxis protein methyltransferase CheR
MNKPFTRSEDCSKDQEFSFTTGNFLTIKKILHDVSGISLSSSKEPLVYSRLSRRLRALGLREFTEYCKLLGSVEGESERLELVSALTTNVTKFFREPHHFEDLKTTVFDKFHHEIIGGKKIRIWSAACSSGEEAYSIAISILEKIPDADKLNIRILATDIDPKIVIRAKLGEYAESSIDGLSSKQIDQYFSRKAHLWAVTDQVRRMVTFAELNLVEQFPMKKCFDAIFCRNVAIYFDKQTQENLWRRFSEQLRPEGRLYIGHSERVIGAALDTLSSAGVTTYSRK